MMFWQKKQTPKPERFISTGKANFPNGICVETEEGRYLMADGYRFRITSDQVFDSWNFPRVAQATEAAVADYRVFRTLGFRNGTVIRSLEDGLYYLIVDSYKQKIASPDVFKRLGLTENEAVLSSVEDAVRHKTKEDELV